MHETMVGHGSGDHKGRSNRVWVMKVIITRTKKDIRATLILGEDYLQKEVLKANRPKGDDKFSKLTDYFTVLNQHECLSDIGIEWADISQKTVKQPKHGKINQKK